MTTKITNSILTNVPKVNRGVIFIFFLATAKAAIYSPLKLGIKTKKYLIIRLVKIKMMGYNIIVKRQLANFKLRKENFTCKDLKPLS